MRGVWGGAPVWAVLLTLMMLGQRGLAQPAADGWSLLQPGTVLLMRHANAPGVGDPPQMRLGDCQTQRNLDSAGRVQASRWGAELARRLAAQKLVLGAVWSSRWCRTQETARLVAAQTPRPTAAQAAQAAHAAAWEVRGEPAFDSFFGNAQSAPEQTAAALRALQAWRGPGVLLVVSHQVNISALLNALSTSNASNRAEGGAWIPSGEAVVLRPSAAGVQVLGRIPAAALN